MRTRPSSARLLLAVLALALGLLGPAALARAEGPNAIQDLDGCEANTLDANDDESTGAVALPFALDFFGNEYSNVFVNNNGNVTFDQALNDYTPFDFTVSGTPMIAPFLADVDTTGDGSGVVTYGETTVDGKPAFCVLWVNVGYFGSHTDKLNSFQLLLVQQGDTGDFDILINYDKVLWETGDFDGGEGGLGGTSAAAGWSSGDGENSFMFPGSFTNGGLLDSNTSTGLIRGMRDSGGQLGRYVFEVRNAATGPALLGHVDDGSGNDVVNAPVEICPAAGGACRVRNTNQTGNYRASNLPAGDYELTAQPPTEGPGSDGTPGRGQVTMGTSDTTKDLTLGPAPSPPPAGTTITSIGETPGGLPVLFWDDPLTIETQGCPGGTATFTITVEGVQVRNGGMTEGPAGTYTASTGPLEPASGDGVVTIEIDCPVTDETIEFGIYIDPSGHIRDHTGAPVAGATVTLFRSSNSTGPFFPVPDGSAIMSPANRVNPDTSRDDGRFGWDVVAGYYLVRASKSGCVDNATRSRDYAESAIMTIPPPVTDLDLRLFCPAEPSGNGNNNTGGGGGGAGGVGGVGGQKARFASLGRVSVAGGKVKIKVSCAKQATGTCAGSVAITPTAAAKKSQAKKKAKKAVVIGKARFKNIKAGKSKIVTVKLNKAGKKLAKKGKVKAKVTVKVRDTSGAAAQTLTKKVTIPKAKKRKR